MGPDPVLRRVLRRHPRVQVVLPPEVAKLLPKNRLLSEVKWGFCLKNEWRAIGVQQSRGWVHYAIHRPEPQIMLFRRPLNYHQMLPKILLLI